MSSNLYHFLSEKWDSFEIIVESTYNHVFEKKQKKH